MKQYCYNLILSLPTIVFFIVYFIVVRAIRTDVDQHGRWIAKNVFSDIVKEKEEDGTLRWLFKDIDLTLERRILHRVLVASSYLFLGMLLGANVMFWQLFLVEVSSGCDVNDSSKDCFEITPWAWTKQDPINCSSAVIQKGTSYVLCYKIVFNFGVAIGASYGVFKMSIMAFSLSSSILLMTKKHKILCVSRIIITLLFIFVISISVVWKMSSLGVAFLSSNITVFLQITVITWNLFIFLWYIPWDKLINLNAERNNVNDNNSENLDSFIDYNKGHLSMEMRGVESIGTEV